MFKASSQLILFTCITGMILIVSLKLYNPQFVYFHSSLVLIILLTVFLEKKFYTTIFGFLSVAIIIFSFFSNGNMGNKQELIQHSLISVVALITMFIVLHIKKLNQALESERNQMSALFEFGTEGIILINNKNEIVLVNPQAERLFLYDAKEMLGKKLEMLIPDRFHSMYLNFNVELFNDSLSHKLENEGQMYGLKKTGEEFPVEFNLSYYKQQNEFFLLAFIVDVSQRKEVEEKLISQKNQLEKITNDVRKMNSDLEIKVSERTLILQEALQELERSQTELSEALNKEKELSEMKSRFVSMASHEFRTPLSTVLSSASLLSKYPLSEDHDKREKHIRRIKESVKHLNALLEDFLNLGTLEEGKMLIQVEAFNVKAFLQETIDEMKPNLKKGQQFKLEFDGNAFIVTDKRLLKNVLINLLSNATKFSDIDQFIHISGTTVGSKTIIQIKDEGIGIANEDMPYMFSTFYRGKNAFNIQGTGLGLHIVKRYVDLLKGQITLSSKLDEGTVFNIGLPDLKDLA